MVQRKEDASMIHLLPIISCWTSCPRPMTGSPWQGIVWNALSAAVSLEEQASRREQAVSIFRLPGLTHQTLSASVDKTPVSRALPARAETEKNASKPVSDKRQPARREAVTEDDWEEF